MMTGPIQVNTYLAYDESGTGFLVDPGGYDSRLVEVIRQESIDLAYILLTHAHGDHIGGVPAFQEVFPEAKLVAYEGEKELLHDGHLNASDMLLGKPLTLEADLYVRDRQTMTIGQTDVTFFHTPGHTKGSMCIAGDGFVFSGDTLFRASIGRTDFYGGDFGQIIDSIRGVLFAMPEDTVVYPGHMGVTTIGFEKENNPFV